MALSGQLPASATEAPSNMAPKTSSNPNAVAIDPVPKSEPTTTPAVGTTEPSNIVQPAPSMPVIADADAPLSDLKPGDVGFKDAAGFGVGVRV